MLYVYFAEDNINVSIRSWVRPGRVNLGPVTIIIRSLEDIYFIFYFDNSLKRYHKPILTIIRNMCSNPTGPRRIWAPILCLYQLRVVQQQSSEVWNRKRKYIYKTRIQSSRLDGGRIAPHSGRVSQTAEMVVAFDEGRGLELKCINLPPFAKDFHG